MSKINGFREKLASLSSLAAKALDIRDVFVFGGLSMLGYGLYQLRPWLGWAVTGLILLLLGLLWRGR